MADIAVETQKTGLVQFHVAPEPATKPITLRIHPSCLDRFPVLQNAGMYDGVNLIPLGRQHIPDPPPASYLIPVRVEGADKPTACGLARIIADEEAVSRGLKYNNLHGGHTSPTAEDYVDMLSPQDCNCASCRRK